MPLPRLPTADDLARLPACRPLVAAKGVGAPVVADGAVRAYQGRHVTDLCRDLEWACATDIEVVIVAGIGTLTLRWTGNQFEPAQSRPGTATARLSPPALLAQRRTACHGCVYRGDDGCRIAGCRCAGLGQPEHRFSRCPVGTW